MITMEIVDRIIANLFPRGKTARRLQLSEFYGQLARNYMAMGTDPQVLQYGNPAWGIPSTLPPGQRQELISALQSYFEYRSRAVMAEP